MSAIMCIVVTAAYVLLAVRAFNVDARRCRRGNVYHSKASSVTIAALWPMSVLVVGVGLIIFDQPPSGFEKERTD